LILGLHVNWPRDYVHHNPDTRWLDERGRGACGNVMFLRSFERQLPEGMIWWPSPYHPKPIEDAAEVIRQLVLHLRTTPYWPHVAGFFVLGGHDGQFHIRAPDYSQTATHAWRQWLAQRYGSDEALAQAWHRPGATLAT